MLVEFSGARDRTIRNVGQSVLNRNQSQGTWETVEIQKAVPILYNPPQKNYFNLYFNKKCYFLINSYFVFTLWIKKIEPDELNNARKKLILRMKSFRK